MLVRRVLSPFPPSRWLTLPIPLNRDSVEEAARKDGMEIVAVLASHKLSIILGEHLSSFEGSA